MDDYTERFENPYIAAERGYIDEVIVPHETRPRLIGALRLLATKHEPGPAAQARQHPAVSATRRELAAPGRLARRRRPRSSRRSSASPATPPPPRGRDGRRADGDRWLRAARLEASATAADEPEAVGRSAPLGARRTLNPGKATGFR